MIVCDSDEPMVLCIHVIFKVSNGIYVSSMMNFAVCQMSSTSPVASSSSQSSSLVCSSLRKGPGSQSDQVRSGYGHGDPSLGCQP